MANDGRSFGGDDVDKRITDAVFELMRDTDIPRIRVADVLRLSGVARSTFYRHFDSVDDVVKAFEADLLDNMRSINRVAIKARFNEAELEATAGMISRMEVLREHRDQIVALNGPHGDPTFVHKATVFMHDYLSERISEVLGPSETRELYLAFVVAGHHNLVQYWLEKNPEIEPETIAAVLNRLYYSPFFLEEGGSSLASAKL